MFLPIDQKVKDNLLNIFNYFLMTNVIIEQLICKVNKITLLKACCFIFFRVFGEIISSGYYLDNFLSKQAISGSCGYAAIFVPRNVRQQSVVM